MADDTTQKLPAHLRDDLKWQPGKSGNPTGRPKGARSKLGEAFIEAMHDNFMEHGVETIEIVRTEKPDQYLKVIASLLPKEMTLNLNDDRAELSDDELVERIRALTEGLAPFIAGGTGKPPEAATDQDGAIKPARIH